MHKLLLIAAIIVVICCGAGAHVYATMNNHQDIEEDLQWMEQIVAEVAGDDIRFVAVNYGSMVYSTPDHLAEEAERISEILGMKLNFCGNDTFAGHVQVTEHTGFDAALKFEKSGQAHLITTVESTRLENHAFYHDWFTSLGDRLAEVGLTHNDWRIHLQAQLVKSPSKLWGLLAAQGVQPVEQYEDIHSISYAYSAPFMYGAVESGEHTVHLQAAVHQSTETGAYRLTLGSPVITIEY